MLLAILIHLLLDEAESAIDDLLVKLKLSLFLVQILLCTLNLNWVEVEQLVFLLKDLEKALRLHAFVQDFILNAPSELDLLLILGLFLLHLLLDLADLLVEDHDLLFCVLFLERYGSPDIKLLLALLGYQPVQLLDLGLIVFVLLISQLNYTVFLRDLIISVLVLLFFNDLSHLFDLMDGLGRCLKPLHI